MSPKVLCYVAHEFRVPTFAPERVVIRPDDVTVDERLVPVVNVVTKFTEGDDHVVDKMLNRYMDDMYIEDLYSCPAYINFLFARVGLWGVYRGGDFQKCVCGGGGGGGKV